MTAVAPPLNARQIALSSLSRLPPFSPTLSRLLATLSSGQVAFARLSDLIEKDAILAGNVLAMVNSAVYGRRGRVNSVRHAVSLLGVDKLRNVALGMSITKLWAKVRTPPGWSTANFNQHAIGTALLSDMLSQEAAVAYPEGAFVAGLLHDLGELLLAFALPGEYLEIERVGADGEMRILGFTHAELSAEALKSWNLPEPIQTAVRYHSNPESDPTPVESGQFPLSRLIASANRYVNETGVGIRKTAAVEEINLDEIFGELNIDAHLARILDEFKAEYDQMAALV